MLILALAFLLGLPFGCQASLHCAERRDISPCTCSLMHQYTRTIDVNCERMTSFGQVVNALHGRFQAGVQLSLTISYSQLHDLAEHSFQDLHIAVSRLSLKHNNLSQLPESAFGGLQKTMYLSLADNALSTVPAGVLVLMPKVRTLDLGRSHLRNVNAGDFQGTPELLYLVLVGNHISVLEKNSLPRKVKHLHLGRNNIRHLNGTLRELVDLEWLFLNMNQIQSLDGQLPEAAEKLTLFHASNNQLERLPLELRNCPHLDVVFAEHNSLTALNGVFSRARKLKQLWLTHNKIQRLAEDEFAEVEDMRDLHLGHNLIYSLNSSLLPVRGLETLNMSHNLLDEFSLLEIRGLQKLKTIDLSHNRIVRLVGRMENVVDSETRVEELRLEYNSLYSLEGALGGLQGLQRLNLSHNLLDRILPGDLIGLDQLKVLDVSFNRLRTLDETSKTFMPALEELLASHNLLQALERDFHGLPALCKADLANNNISRIHHQLTARTRCTVHGVPGTLRIYLQDNPLRCDENLAHAMLVFQHNMTELQGVTPCALTLSPVLLAPGLVGAALPRVTGVPVVPGVAAGVPVLAPALTPVFAPAVPALAPGAQAPTLVLPIAPGIAFPLQPADPLNTATVIPSSLPRTPPPTTPSTTTTPTEPPPIVIDTTTPSTTTHLPVKELHELPPKIHLLDGSVPAGSGMQPEVLVQKAEDRAPLMERDPEMLKVAEAAPVPIPIAMTPSPPAPPGADSPVKAPPMPPVEPTPEPAVDTIADAVPESPPAAPPEVPQVPPDELPPLIELLNQTAS